MHALKLAAYVFGVIFVAELPDKTTLAALVLATRHKPFPVFLGASAALTVQSIVAVAAGSLFARLPQRPVHIGAGTVFLVCSVWMWFRKEDGQDTATGSDERGDRRPSLSFWRAFGTVFGVVFIAEWGDLTQFATAAFAAQERAPLIVFFAATLALWAVAGIAVGVGNRTAKILDPKLTKRVAAVLFAAIGVALVVGRL